MSEFPFIRLSELAAEVSMAITQAFYSRSFWVIADVTSHTFKRESNFHYFELVEKDKASNTITAKFASRAWGIGSQRIVEFENLTGQKFGNDLHVLVNVTVDYHPTYGLQLSVADINSDFSLGMIEQQRQATLLRLLNENPLHVKLVDQRYFTFNSSLTLRRVLQRIAILSSNTSAGLQDFVHTLENNTAGYRFYADQYVVKVHGENNARQFVDKMIEVFHSGIDYDALVIVRGGGAQADLLLFNDYSIGRAIARFPVPVITGIGHQKNETIADLMAHTATKTPTQAAELIIAHNKLFEDQLLNFQKRLVIRSQQVMAARAKELSQVNSLLQQSARSFVNYRRERLMLTNQLVVNTSRSVLFANRSLVQTLSARILTKSRSVIYNSMNDLENVRRNLSTFKNLYLRNKQCDLHHRASMIRMMAPENILRKGFAVVKVNGKITANTVDIEAGAQIAVLLSNKEIKANVISKEDYAGSEFDL